MSIVSLVTGSVLKSKFSNLILRSLYSSKEISIDKFLASYSNCGNFKVESENDFEPMSSVETNVLEDDSNYDEYFKISNALKEMAEQISGKDSIVNAKSPPVSKLINSLHLRHSLKAYINACAICDMHETGHKTFLWYRYKYYNSTDPEVNNFLDESVYNVLLKSWADVGNLRKVNEIFDLMISSKLRPNLQTYACYLLCLFNQNEIDLFEVDKIVTKLQKNGYFCQNLLKDCSLNLKQKKKIEDCFKRIYPNLVFSKTNINTTYKCNILKDFHKTPRTGYNLMGSIDCSKMNEWVKTQQENELKGRVKVKSVYKGDESSETLMCKTKWQELLQEWQQVLTESFQFNLILLKNKLQEQLYINIYPYLLALEPEIYVDIMLDEVINYAKYSSFYSPPASYLHYTLGLKVANSYLSFIRLNYYAYSYHIYDNFIKYINDPFRVKEQIPRTFWLNCSNSKGYYINSDVDEMVMPLPAILSVGRFLYDMITHDLKIDPNLFKKSSKSAQKVPIFYSVYVTHHYSTKAEIRASPVFSKLYRTAGLDDLYFPTTLLPMTSPPVPWLSIKTGGFLFNNLEFIKSISSNDQEALFNLKLAKESNIDPIYDSLNALSMIPWKINKKILDLIISVFQNNGDLSLDIPYHSSKMPPLPKVKESLSQDEKLPLLKKRFRVKRARAEMYSLWCDCLYKLSIANHVNQIESIQANQMTFKLVLFLFKYRDQIFWLPHNIDFRGRVYATPPHFNHLGNDVARSIMLFAIGKPLGTQGLDWLKIHLINLTGHKKRSSLNERLQYCNEMLPFIIDSVEKPFDGQRWWTQSEEPWQTLACCFEIYNAMKCPNPEEYICHFPVHQDGSCNGLQHYAALGKDIEGAISVNLSPSNKPNDVYSEVANLVEQSREKDSQNGNIIAANLKGFVQRKVIKQTVMTYVYGVTHYGAKLQIMKQLKNLPTFPQEHNWKAAIYLTKKTFNSIEKMFTATQKIQNWLTNCAKLISKNLGEPVQWRTPLGFPVIQPYFKTSLNYLNIEALNTMHTFDMKPNTVKQKNAFPPNFIHSLDSSHMMLTALHCEKKGINFVAVHDSYWTHPCDVDEMNLICREQFLKLHSEDILKDLSSLMIEKYGDKIKEYFQDGSPKALDILKGVPKTGNFNLKVVLKSRYFFS